MSVRQFLAAHSSREIAEMIAFDQIEPQGEERADLRMSIQTTALLNAFREKGTPEIPKDRYVPDFREKPKATADDKVAVAQDTRALVSLAGRNAARAAESHPSD